MLAKEKVGKQIAFYRKKYDMTQIQLAEALHVTHQSISRWELGLSLPSIDILYQMSQIWKIPVDALLKDNGEDRKNISFEDAGLNTANLFSTKMYLQQLIEEDEFLLRSRYTEPVFLKTDTAGMKEPVHILQMGVPGSKGRLMRECGQDRNLCKDLVAGMVNNTMRYGARSLFLQAHVVTGNPNKEQMIAMGEALKEACVENQVRFAGLEISAQPANYRDNEYEMRTALVGVAERKEIITGQKIKNGDAVIAVMTEGIDSTSYPIIKVMLGRNPGLIGAKIDKEHYFVDEILKPNHCYAHAITELKKQLTIHGMMRVTTSVLRDGIYADMVPKDLGVCINLSVMPVLPLYRFIADLDMTGSEYLPHQFSFGVGLLVIVSSESSGKALEVISKYHDCYQIGEVRERKSDSGQVVWTEGGIAW